MRKFVSILGVMSILLALPWAPPVQGSKLLQSGSDVAAFAPVEIPDRNRCGPASIPSVETDLVGERADEIELLYAEHSASDGFRAAVYHGDEAILVVDPTTLGEWKKRVSGIRIAPSCVPEALIQSAKEAIQEMKLDDGHYAFAGYDGLRDVVFAESSVPIEEVEQAIAVGLRRRGEDASIAAIAKVDRTLRLRQREPGNVRQANRGSDTAPFFGGAKIRIVVPGGRSDCSSGFYINSATNGTVMVTAGHCSDANGADVDNGNLTADLGAIEGRSFPSPDLALIDGSQYAATSFAWNDQTTAKAITGSAEPAVGVTYCQYGYLSLRRCGSYIDLDVPFNGGGGVTQHTALMSSPGGPGQSLGQPGDSGAGVFREAGNTIGARGTVVGGFCDAQGCFRFDHKLSTIKNKYNATVVIQ